MALLDIHTAKEYLRVDGNDEDTLISSMIESAESYLSGAVDDFATKASADNSFCRLALQAELMYVKEFYDNRDATTQEIAPMISRIVTMLQYWG